MCRGAGLSKAVDGILQPYRPAEARNTSWFQAASREPAGLGDDRWDGYFCGDGGTSMNHGQTMSEPARFTPFFTI